MKVLIVGDTHGNGPWLSSYIFPVAMTHDVDRIVVVGDFGAWEHTDPGREFMNTVGRLATKSGIALYWLHGNHDKWSHTVKAYGGQRTEDGFIRCRDSVFYIPQGHSWTWNGVRFRSFGGAYSIDKSWRIQAEDQRFRNLQRELRSQVGAGKLLTAEMAPSQAETLWFPEEEMTDSEMEQLLLDDFGRKDIVLSHDKPLSAKPDWDRKDIPACVPNQLRLERALRVHRPTWWIHGHLHHHYTHMIHGDTWVTEVIGLDPDAAAAQSNGWRRENSWALLDLASGPDVWLGKAMEVDMPRMVAAREALAA